MTPIAQRLRELVALATVTLPLACAPPSTGAERPTIVVPAQPAQPLPPPPSSPPAPTAVAAGAFRCDGGKRYEVQGLSYCAYTEPDTWEGSERRCVANGGHLVTLNVRVTSDALHDALGSPVYAGRAVWIGLERVTKGGKKAWTWTTGEPLGDASWSTGEPNDFDGREACTEWLVVDGRWNDTRCELEQHYVCQSVKDKPLACKLGHTFAAGGVTYCQNAVARTFAEAKRACVADGGALATPRTRAENQVLRDAMAARFPVSRMWIGLTDAAEEDHWVWASGEPYFEFERWQPHEPNNFNGENCVELHAASWSWNDLDCGVALPSVCESAR